MRLYYTKGRASGMARALAAGPQQRQEAPHAECDAPRGTGACDGATIVACDGSWAIYVTRSVSIEP